ncbi:hypothetical protein FALCPG4_013952 [Fusarium falciforme]
MKAQTIIAVLIAATGASANCIESNEHCEWFGSSPFCGSTKSKYGDKDSSGRTLRWTTDGLNHGDFCRPGGILGEDCCIDYGYPCLSGYKRLWCYAEIPEELREKSG